MYSIKGIHKAAERDSYEQGCIGDCQDSYIDYVINAESLDELAEKFREFCCAEEVEKNTCDEPGRIDCQVLENAEGFPLSKWEWERFKAGEIEAWAVTYTAYAKYVAEFAVSF